MASPTPDSCTSGSPLLTQSSHIASSEGSISEHVEQPSPGLSWRHTLSSFVIFIAAGFVANAHHIYYYRLDGTVAGSTDRQQWAIRIGTALAFLVQSLLRTVVSFACVQLVWRTLRHRALTIGTINHLFSLTTDITALFQKELYIAARPTIIMALVVWLLPIAAVVPPACLSVVTAHYDWDTMRDIRVLDYTASEWSCPSTSKSGCTLTTLRRITEETVRLGDILSLPVAAANSTYSYQFNAPSVACSPANETQMSAFEHVTDQFGRQDCTFVASTINGTHWNECLSNLSQAMSNTSLEIVPVAMNPFSAFIAIPQTSDLTSEGSDYSNNILQLWSPNLGTYNYSAGELEMVKDPGASQIWIQLFNESLVCTLVNASFMVRVDNGDGVQNLTVEAVEQLDSVYYPSTDLPGAENPVYDAYQNLFYAFASTIVGNVSLSTDSAVSSQILQTDLSGCAELNITLFQEEAISAIGAHNNSILGLLPFIYDSNLAQSVYGTAGSCRNNTLALALEDLANNVTLSMLSSALLTTPSSSPITVHLEAFVYSYHMANLWISYGIAMFISLCAFAIGLYAMRKNGVTHSKHFSAMIATTRNPTLDALFRDHVETTDQSDDVLRQKLQYGPLSLHNDVVAGRPIISGFGTEQEIKEIKRLSRIKA